MSFSDIWKMCRDNLKRRKGRTILTVLGVFIGCTSIVVMVSIGIGMKESQDRMLAEIGDLSIIEVYAEGGHEGDGAGGQKVKLDEDAVKSFKEISGVAAVMPKMSLDSYSISLTAGINDRYKADWANVVGLDTSAMEAMGFEIIDGKTPGTSLDEVVAGQYFAYSFRDTLMPDGRNMVDRWSNYDENGNQTELPEPFFNPLMTEVTLEITNNMEEENAQSYKKPIKITGITKEDTGKGWETSEGLMMSIDTIKDIISKVSGKPAGKMEYTGILVKAADIKLVTEVEKSIQDLGYQTYSMESMRESMEKSARQVQLMLGGLGAISLFVAAIGITNTMIMSISERTREIGIMKALGCFVKDIRMLFLMEAGTIGLMGGIIGCIVSLCLSVIINLVAMGAMGGMGEGFSWQLLLAALIGGEDVSRISVIPLSLMAFAIVFSVFVGLVSGYYPANKAVKIPALEAIKHE